MTSKKTTRRALLSSMLALLLCVSMLVGSTFAWFTDEVTSTGNIIKSGTLDVVMTHSDDNQKWEDASQGAIFDYQYWEPGYTQTKYVKVVNNGDLAFKYQLHIIPNELPVAGEVNLAEVIDVYMFDPSATVDRAAIAAATPVGTLADMMSAGNGAANGTLLPAEGKGSDNYNDIDAPHGEITYCIVLKMREEAGNEYQDLSVGEGFKVQLNATQYTWEKDSFDHEYDDGADFAPKAEVKLTGAKMVTTSTHGEIWANTTFQFQPTQSYEEAQQSSYRYWHADFVVSADNDIPANAVILPGYYAAYCDNYNNGEWIGLSSDETIPAGTEIRLVDTLGQMLGGTVYVNYEEICNYGNDEVGFLCGVSDQSKGALAGTTLTVELRLYETTGDPNTDYGSKNEETGEYITISTYTYTFGALEVSNADELADAIADGATNLYLTAGTYTFPKGLTKDTTLTCAEGTVFEGKTSMNANGATIIGATFSNPGDTAATSTVNGTFKNCTFTGTNALRWCYAGETVVFEDCVFSGDVYGVHFDGGANEVYFKNCTFSGFNAMGGAITKLTMEGCTFKANDTSNYNGINLWGSVEMIDCTFVFDGSVEYEWVDLCGDGKTATFANCVVSDGTNETALDATVVGDYGEGNTIIFN